MKSPMMTRILPFPAQMFILFACLIVSLSAGASEGTSESFRKAHTDAVRFAVLQPGGVFGFFEPGEAVTFRLVIDGTAKNYEYTLTVKDDTGKVVHSQDRTALTGEIRIPGQERGYYSAESEIYADGVRAYTIQGGFAVAPVPGKRDPFFLFGQGVIPLLHDGYKRVGCGTIQMKLHSINKPEEYERKVRFFMNLYAPYLKSGDFHLQVGLGTGLERNVFRTPEELEAGYPLLKDEWLQQYLKFLTEMQPVMKSKEWFIGQETPSHATMKDKYAGTWSEAMSQFVVMTRMGSRLLKKLDPEIRIYAGGNNIPERTDDIEPIEMGDIVRDFDYYYIDAYTGNWDLAQGRVLIPEIDLMRFYRKASAFSVSLGKGKYIVNNETGYSIPYGARFDRGLAPELARLTARTIIISKAAPVLHFHLFQPNTYAYKGVPKDTDRHMTTIWKSIQENGRYYYVPMPGGAMYATAASELAFAKFEAEIIQGSVYSYIFARPDGSALITLWNTDAQQPFDAVFPELARILNMYGRDITSQKLAIGPDPVYISLRCSPADAVKFMKAAVRNNVPEAVCTALPDRVYVKSLISEVREGEIRIPGREPVKVKILPAKVNVFDMPVSGSGELVIGTRTCEIPLEKQQTIRLKRVSGTEELRGTEPGLLHYPDHIRPLEALHPERCYFRTPDFNPNGHNVSAKYWAGYDDANFYFAAEVDDPVHIQRNTGANIWRDDCLQFVFSPVDYTPTSVLRLTNEKRPVSPYNFGLALTSQGPQLVKFTGKDAGIKTYPAKVTREGGLTRYELAIPWSALGGKAKRFGFLIWDCNSMSEPRAPYRLEFTPGIADGADSSQLAKVEYE